MALKLASDQVQDHRLGSLEERVKVHGKVLDDLTSSVAVLNESVQNTNNLLRECLTAFKRGLTAISAIAVSIFGAGQLI